MPENTRFAPVGSGNGEIIKMTVDEFEAIRLIDLLNLNQKECSQRMDIARSTAQSIYNSARRKLAQCLVNGAELRVDGGQYSICDGKDNGCGCDCKDRQQNNPAPASQNL